MVHREANVKRMQLRKHTAAEVASELTEAHAAAAADAEALRLVLEPNWAGAFTPTFKATQQALQKLTASVNLFKQAKRMFMGTE